MNRVVDVLRKMGGGVGWLHVEGGGNVYRLNDKIGDGFDDENPFLERHSRGYGQEGGDGSEGERSHCRLEVG